MGRSPAGNPCFAVGTQIHRVVANTAFGLVEAEFVEAMDAGFLEHASDMPQPACGLTVLIDQLLGLGPGR